MSCISKILELKQNNRINAFKKGFMDEYQIIPEGGGIYNGYEYLITFSPNGFRCGYVAIPATHSKDKEIEEAHDSVGIECHGGVTFNSRKHRLKKLLDHSCNDNWIGFDCGHSYDAIDKASYLEYYDEPADGKGTWCDLDGKVRDFNYVESECKSIIDQLIQMESANGN